MSRVLCYSDRGTSPRMVHEMLICIQQLFPDVLIRSVLAPELRSPQWMRTTAALIVPGGRDLPYLEDLRGSAVANIRKFVEQGGCYYGFCAGAYFGANRIIFEPGTRNEVTGSRPLDFFPGLALGATSLPYEYDSEEGSSALTIERTDAQGQATRCRVYSNGGCAFLVDPSDERQDQVTTLAFYSEPVCERHGVAGKLPAIVRIRVGCGAAVLSGVHLEVSEECDLLAVHIAAPRSGEFTGSSRENRAIADEMTSRAHLLDCTFNELHQRLNAGLLGVAR